jgi:hypothetical protein
LTKENENDTSAQDVICKELFYNKKFSKNIRISNKVKNELNVKYTEDTRSVISSDNDDHSTPNRGRSHVVVKQPALFQSYSSKNNNGKKFVIKKSSVRGDKTKGHPLVHTSLSNYKISKNLAGMLEEQMQELIISKGKDNRNQFLLNINPRENNGNFLPYKNAADLKVIRNMSRSQRNRKLSGSNSKNRSDIKPMRNENLSARSNYIRNNKVPTPRYQGNRVKLVKGKNHIIQAHRRSGQYNDRSRQVRSSGVRSNTKSRPGDETKLVNISNP